MLSEDCAQMKEGTSIEMRIKTKGNKRLLVLANLAPMRKHRLFGRTKGLLPALAKTTSLELFKNFKSAATFGLFKTLDAGRIKWLLPLALGKIQHMMKKKYVIYLFIRYDLASMDLM